MNKKPNDIQNAINFVWCILKSGFQCLKIMDLVPNINGDGTESHDLLGVDRYEDFLRFKILKHAETVLIDAEIISVLLKTGGAGVFIITRKIKIQNSYKSTI